MGKLAVVTLAAIAVMLATAAAARADDTRCTGELRHLIVVGNLVVPAGADCSIRDLAVRGDVLVLRGAGLRVLGGVAILGDVLADGCQFVDLDPSTPAGSIAVGGDVDIQRCSNTSGKLFTAGHVVIGGGFRCHDNRAPCFAVSLTIGGDAEIRRNSGGMSYLEGNTIGGNLHCLANTGVTDYGSPNTVAGRKLGQCAALS